MIMAKDTFFIRATTPFNAANFNQTSIDLGAYVDALGKSVLRIHNIAVQWGDPMDSPTVAANQEDRNSFQLTTQSQAAMVDVTNKSVIASGSILGCADAGGSIVTFNDSIDVAPQYWTSGYLVGVEQIYLGVRSTVATSMNLARCSIVLECSVETLSQSAAMALALSQQ